MLNLFFIVIGWIVFIAMIAAFIFGAFKGSEKGEPDETSSAGRYKYTYPKDEDHLIF